MVDFECFGDISALKTDDNSSLNSTEIEKKRLLSLTESNRLRLDANSRSPLNHTDCHEFAISPPHYRPFVGSAAI